MTTPLLEPQAFISKLIEILSGGDGFARAAIEGFNGAVEKYGSEEAFAKADPKLWHYLESAMHRTKDLHARIEGIDFFASSDRFSKSKYLTQAIATFEEASLRFRALAERSQEFAAYPALQTEGEAMLKTLSNCIDFSQAQYRLAEPNAAVRRV